MDWVLVWRAVLFAGALGLAFACALAGVLLAIAGAMGEGFMGRLNRLVRIGLPTILLVCGLGIAITATVLFMKGLPR